MDTHTHGITPHFTEKEQVQGQKDCQPTTPFEVAGRSQLPGFEGWQETRGRCEEGHCQNAASS
jgi:cbb3-type cytochrome oxidase cytochrome c subunit